MYMRRMSIRTFVTVASLVGTLSCGGEETLPPVPGSVAVNFSSPNGTDGAVLFTITGPGMGNLAPASSSNQLFTRLVAPQELRVIIVGNLGSGPLFTMDIPNTNDVSGFNATVLQVADRDDDLRESVAGYSITLPMAASPNPSPSVLDPNP